jgi:hypothetical protein
MGYLMPTPLESVLGVLGSMGQSLVHVIFDIRMLTRKTKHELIVKLIAQE